MNPNAFVELINKKKKFYGIKFFDFLDRIEMSEASYKRRKKTPANLLLFFGQKTKNANRVTETAIALR